jgi:cobalt/nickel transport system ATP-binding protein
MASVLEIKNLEYTFQDTQTKLLKGVNLEVKRNQLVAIVGRIGGGKSTLLQHMNGLIKPQSGDVIINGKSVTQRPNYPFHQEVGLLFENPDDQIFYPIVADDIAFGPRNLKFPQNVVNSRVTRAAEEVGILHLLERDTGTLSYGEKTLVALAGILAMNCKIILMDSPEIGLDLWSRPKILDLIDQLRVQHTLVVSTNDTDMLKRADRILLLWNGKIRNTFLSYETFRASMNIPLNDD